MFIVGRRMNIQLQAEEDQYLRKAKRVNDKTLFHNCSQFRLSLYTLKERLLPFIEQVFTEFIRLIELSNNLSHLRREIRDKVRTSDPKGWPLRNEERRSLIDDPSIDITADWWTIAKCYTGNFVSFPKRYRGSVVTYDYEKISAFTVDKADPKDLLEVLKNCSLFKAHLYYAARSIILNRNLYYGHIAQLFIESKTLETLNAPTAQLHRYISNPAVAVDYLN